MARVLITPLSLLSRRTYSSVAVVERLQQAAVAPTKKAASDRRASSSSSSSSSSGGSRGGGGGGGGESLKEEIFWMKNPKTGNWIPENHFGDIDVAELRQQLLSKK